MLLSGNFHARFSVQVEPEMSKRWIVESEPAVVRPDAVLGVAVVTSTVLASVKASPTMSEVTEIVLVLPSVFDAKL